MKPRVPMDDRREDPEGDESASELSGSEQLILQVQETVTLRQTGIRTNNTINETGPCSIVAVAHTSPCWS